MGGDSGMQGQRADQQGILYPTRAFRKELLLLAKEASRTDRGRSSRAGFPGRISGTVRGAAHSISWGRTNTSGAGRYGYGSGASALHSVTMIDLTKVRNYYIACGYTDLRLGIDGLAAVVTQQHGSHLDEESLFLFCGRRTDRIRALYWCGDGYILLYKRLSNGKFQWPRSEAELRLLDPQSSRWLMEGLRIEQKTVYSAAEVAALEETILKLKTENDELRRKLEHMNEVFVKDSDAYVNTYLD